jgi:FkbM family methyltransferase
MGKLKRELASAVNNAIPRFLRFQNYGREWKIPNVPGSMQRLMRPGRDALTGEWVNRYVPQADLIVDIGANVGQSLMLYRSLFPQARYIGLEPNPISSAVLCRLIALNDLQDAKVFTAGIAPAFSTAQLLVNPRRLDDPSATLVPQCHEAAVARLAVPIITARLQDLVPGIALSTSSVIKIDVEGFEADVLESLGDLVEGRPVIVSEVLAQWSGDDAARALLVRRLHAWVDANRYAIVAVGHGAIERLSRDWESYLFVPAELEGPRPPQ